MREFQDYEEQQKKIKKMKEAIKRLHQWANEANPPNPGLHRQARNMERALGTDGKGTEATYRSEENDVVV